MSTKFYLARLLFLRTQICDVAEEKIFLWVGEEIADRFLIPDIFKYLFMVIVKKIFSFNRP